MGGGGGGGREGGGSHAPLIPRAKRGIYPHPTTTPHRYDPEGWSIWTCRFKFNEENKVAFQTANATGGFVQRSGEIRKWLFGVM